MLVKILVVSNSSPELATIRNVLGEYSMFTAPNGFEALQMLKEHDGINLLILDLNLPDMDGFQFLETLRADDKYMELSTIILTNCDEPDNEIRGLKLGAVDYSKAD